VRDAEALITAIDEARAVLGSISVLVNNAAIYPIRPFLEIPLTEYDDVQVVNQRAYFVAAQRAARHMAADGGGAIVNIASITMHGGWSNFASYVAAKGAVLSMTRALARELGPMAIRVNAVSPGAIPTAAELANPNTDAYHSYVLEHQALKRRGTPSEIASVVSFLVGPDASFVTGQCVEVNGGWVMT
jgi:NAD(P)-dependent dehydrogenase (short-subunit alcohol dehydrogenase family)